MADCQKWGTSQSPWLDAGWVWSSCGAGCEKWGTTQYKWSDANWLWSMCGPGVIPPPPPVIPSPIRLGVDATTIEQPWIEEPWNPYRSGEVGDKKFKRLIQLVCKVNGEEFKQTRASRNTKVTVNDIKMLVKKAKQIDINLDIGME